ncbi:ABC transporter permease [Thalassobacillus hwangdonensis]|uniref:ABC transporter permease n=1 Tax=Thalassobacillus hwangdonensis TaxID=546108 RepID=A0ABW3L019_9BACI
MKLLKSRTLWLLIPGMIFLILPFYGMLAAVKESFFSLEGWTIEHYGSLFESSRFLSSLGFSIRTALIATILSLLLGLLLTKAFHKYLDNYRSRLSVWLPMLFPHFVWGYIVILLLSETGWLAKAAFELGMIQAPTDFPIWTRDDAGVGIILTYVWKEVPFVILMLYPVYASIPSSYKDLVATLGGGNWHVFKTVEWRAIFPAFIETGIIIFAFTLTAYEVPYLLGTTFPEMISVLSYQWFYGGGWEERPMAFAAMIVISAMIGFLAWLSYRITIRSRFHSMKGN